MKGKYKLTRFAKLVIFLLFISPVCYLAGIGIISPIDALSFEKISEEFISGWDSVHNENDSDSGLDDVEDLKEEIKEIKENLYELEDELLEKENELKELIIELKEV